MQLPSYLHRKQCSVLLVLTGIFHLIGSQLMRCQAPFSEAWRILEELDLLPLALSSKTNNGQKHSRKSVTATSQTMPQIHQNPLLINHKCPSEQEMSAFVFYLIAILAIFHTFCPLFFIVSTRNENFSRPAAQGRQHRDSQGFIGINRE